MTIEQLKCFFLKGFTSQALRRTREAHARGNQGCAKAPFQSLIWALVVQALATRGSLGHHLRTITGKKISDSAATQRKAGLNWAFFQRLFTYVFFPLAKPKDNPESFHKGYLLLGLDGTQFSLRNTLSVRSLKRKKHTNQRKGKAAFFKWIGVVLIELGTHQPLAAACTQERTGSAEGELTIARRALSGVSSKEPTLLLVDRLYGCGRFVRDVSLTCGPSFKLLMRVRKNLKAKVLRVLADGSKLIKVNIYTSGVTRKEGTETLREIYGHVWREAGKDGKPGKRIEVRLWTTLLDESLHPAAELLKLYAQRWEHELFYRELKEHIGRDSLLRSESVATAEVEFGSLLIAASLIAQHRLQGALTVGLPALRLSMLTIKRALQMLVPVLAMAGDLFNQALVEKLIERVLTHMSREAIIPKRRARGCQRGLRKPSSDWLRIETRCDEPGSWACEVLLP